MALLFGKKYKKIKRELSCIATAVYCMQLLFQSNYLD